ncbi:MAG: right-handed parallel beta-helix repeat-containing protein [Dehalococcoidales bacterium]|nr:right-handed parallel beta-helix repeat-containing protein [Dehalococcoidales bacterium]
MKKKIISIMLTLILVLSFSLVTVTPVAAVPVTFNVYPLELTTKNVDSTAEWSTAQASTGSYSAHLDTGAVAAGDEARIVVNMPSGTTLSSLSSISWQEYLVVGYPPHVDVKVDTNGDGTADDALVFEYAYNAEVHCASGWPTYGALTGAWYQTFSDDGEGPIVIDDTANAWLSSGPPGPLTGAGSENFIYGTLAEWKAGTVDVSVDGDTFVTALEIELDNWVVNSEAYVDDITINGAVYYGCIQDAIDAASAGDMVNVTAGTYSEDINIPAGKDNLNLVGAAGATIKGVAMTISTSWPVVAANIEILAQGAAISGFAIQGPDPVAGYYSSGMIIGASDVEISGNAFEITNTDDDVLNDVSQGLQTYSKAAVPGVDISGLNIHGNTFTHLGSGDNGFEAMYINPDEGTGPITIADNTFSGYIVRGITTERSNTIISGNSISTDVTSIVLSGIMARNGLLETQAAITITGNTIENFAQGIRTGAAGQTLTNVTIEENTLTANDVGVKIYDSANGVTVKYNNFIGNTTYGVENADTANSLGAIKNFWGDISGPECEATNPGGTGDMVSADVSYIPWLTRDFQTALDDNIAYFGEPTVSLITGWNKFSTPIALDAGCDTWDEYVALGDGLNIHATSPAYAFDGATQDWLPLIGEDADYALKPCDAIYVRMAAPDTAAILYGSDPSTPTKEIYQGWNLVGLASLDSMPTNSALTSLYMVTGDITGYSMVVSPPLAQPAWNFIRAGAPTVMLPTYGYWVFMENGPDTLAGFSFTPRSLSGVPLLAAGLWSVTFDWYEVTPSSAYYVTDDGSDYSFTYTLPWTFPFTGKDITDIEVSAEGYIELLESGETAENCCDYGTMWEFKDDYPTADFIVAWCDDLVTGDGYYAVEYDAISDKVIIHWVTSVCCDLESNLNYFQLWLFPDGSIQWNYKEFNWETLCCGVVSGIYDSLSGSILNIYYSAEESYLYAGEYLP